MLIIVLFGAIQGFVLSFFLLAKPKENKVAFYYFFFFLITISYFNFSYALHYSEIIIIENFSITTLPFPYKYLIGVCFYFYVKFQVKKSGGGFSKLEYLLFLPAIVYGFLRLYWFVIFILNIDKDIFWNVYVSGFFVYNEIAYLLFNLILAIVSLQFLKKQKGKMVLNKNGLKHWKWVLKIAYSFALFTLCNFLYQILILFFNLEHSGKFYLIFLILNTIYIYWLGFESLVNKKYLFSFFTLKNVNQNFINSSDYLLEKLNEVIELDEIYKRKNLKVADLASLLEITEKELSDYIFENYSMSFSDFINQKRVEKVKELILKKESEKYTLVTIAENAGFNSKTSFNTVFKKHTGLTPTEYKNQHKK